MFFFYLIKNQLVTANKIKIIFGALHFFTHSYVLIYCIRIPVQVENEKYCAHETSPFNNIVKFFFLS